jgi:hypothetical protein
VHVVVEPKDRLQEGIRVHLGLENILHLFRNILLHTYIKVKAPLFAVMINCKTVFSFLELVLQKK